MLLSHTWAHRAQRLFTDAEASADPVEKKGMEHAAMIYHNCVEELLAAEKAANLPSGLLLQSVQQKTEGP